MRFIVEIDPSTVVGADLLKYIADLHAPTNAVKIYKEPSLNDEDMAIPGAPPSKDLLEEWLSKPDYGFIEGDAALQLLKEELAAYRTNIHLC